MPKCMSCSFFSKKCIIYIIQQDHSPFLFLFSMIIFFFIQWTEKIKDNYVSETSTKNGKKALLVWFCFHSQQNFPFPLYDDDDVDGASLCASVKCFIIIKPFILSSNNFFYVTDNSWIEWKILVVVISIIIIIILLCSRCFHMNCVPLGDYH